MKALRLTELMLVCVEVVMLCGLRVREVIPSFSVRVALMTVLSLLLSKRRLRLWPRRESILLAVVSPTMLVLVCDRCCMCLVYRIVLA